MIYQYAFFQPTKFYSKLLADSTENNLHARQKKEEKEADDETKSKFISQVCSNKLSCNSLVTLCRLLELDLFTETCKYVKLITLLCCINCISAKCRQCIW